MWLITTRLIKLFFFSVLCVMNTHLAAQCFGGSLGGSLTPIAGSWQTTSILAANYYEFTVPASDISGCSAASYSFSFCAADGGASFFNSEMTILDNSGSVVHAYNNDFCSTDAYINWTPTTAGTYRLLITESGCVMIGFPGTLAYTKSTPPGGGGSPNLYYQLVDDAVNGAASDCVQLTAASNNQLGCAWALNQNMNFLAAFTVDFTVNLGTNDGGADGMAFIMHNDPGGQCVCGVNGGSLGADGISSSVIIELDTYLNTHDRDDGLPGVACVGGDGPDHIDLWLNGNVNPSGISCPSSPGARIIPAAIAMMNGGSPYNIENGLDHTFRINWTPGAPNGTLTVQVMDAAALTTYASLSYVFDPLITFGTTTPYYGFTAATGGLNNQQGFCGAYTPLAVQWVDLSLSQEAGQNWLNWSIIEDGQIHAFEIERQLEGELIWQSIGYLSSHWTENTAEPGNYQLALETKASAQYFRVKALTQDGRHFYSSVLEWKGQSGSHLILKTDWEKQLVVISFSDAQRAPYQIQLFDSQGRLIHQNIWNEDITELPLSIKAMASGIYELRLIGTGKSLHRKFLVP